jgi:predicted GNAT family acetyltransferase
MPNQARPEVTDNESESRYEIHVDGELAGFARYQLAGDRIVLPDTQIDPAFRGRGLGQVLAKAALEDVRAQGRTVEPRCEFIAAYIREHPEHHDLIASAAREDRSAA